MTQPGFGEAARPHLGWLYSLARRLIGDPDTAEDVVQKALLKACRSFDEVRDLDALPAWLKRILVNCCRDHWRSEGRGFDETSMEDMEGPSLYRILAVEDPLPYSDSLHLDFLSTFTTEDVWAVLARLKTIYRVPLVLVHMEGYSTAEVADLLDTPRNTILSRLHRGRKRFETELWDYAQERGLLRDLEGATS
ncbi:MAG: RNA polymerase sigma factor [Nitriliruptorales bacterium]|nr:RNA polymerase sigma factor [Nitriliruptorales bacterium]